MANNTDYQDIKKGIKRAEYDRYKYYGNIIWSILAGVAVGAMSKNIVAGIVVFFIVAIISARKYFELGK